MTVNADAVADAVLKFWFENLGPEDWFSKDDAVDQRIIAQFSATYEALAQDDGEKWLGSARTALAAVIVLDQFPRNMFREDPRSFATDEAALNLSKAAVAAGFSEHLSLEERQFLLMPFQHSESAEDQARSVTLFSDFEERTQNFAMRHKEIIDRFGRFPHRNAILGRQTTPEEEAFLKEPDSSF